MTKDKASNRAATTPQVVDLTGLEAPEPMTRILMACRDLEDGDLFSARLPHIPHPLFPHLETRGLEWETEEEAGGTVLLHIRRRS